MQRDDVTVQERQTLRIGGQNVVRKDTSSIYLTGEFSDYRRAQPVDTRSLSRDFLYEARRGIVNPDGKLIGVESDPICYGVGVEAAIAHAVDLPDNTRIVVRKVRQKEDKK